MNKKSTLLQNELKDQSKFEERILNIFIKEFEERITLILSIKPGEFLDTFNKRVSMIIEDTYGNEALDSNILTDIMKRCQGKIYERFYVPTIQQLEKRLKEYESADTQSQKNFLLTNFHKHCANDENIGIHTCKGKLIFVTNKDRIQQRNTHKQIGLKEFSQGITHLICTSCRKVYLAHSINLFCSHCNTEYTSSVLNVNENIDSAPATWEKYHCGALVNGAMNCIKCKNIFYLNLKTNRLFCKSCLFETDPMNLLWTCFACKKDFRTNAKVYNPQEFKEIKNTIRDTLIQKKKAFPSKVPCCVVDIQKIEFFHKNDCRGLIFSGEINSKKVIICEKCHVMNNESSYLWTCPICLKTFNDISLDKPVEKPIDTSQIYNAPSTKAHYRKKSSDLLKFDEEIQDEPQKYNKKIIRHSATQNFTKTEINQNVSHLVSPVKNYVNNIPKETIQLKQIPVEKKKFDKSSDEASPSSKKLSGSNNLTKSPIKLAGGFNKSSNLRSPERINSDKINQNNNQSPIKLMKDQINRNEKSPSKGDNDSKKMKINFNENQNYVSENKNGNIISISINNLNIITNEKNENLKDRDFLKTPIKSMIEDLMKNENLSADLQDKTPKLKTFNSDDYKIIKKIGEGSYAQCYLVTDKQNNQYAMKKILGNNENDIQVYLDELNLVNINKHSNILKILGYSRKKLDETTLALFVLMELAKSDWDSEIKNRISTKQQYNENELLDILFQTTKALSFLQRSSIAHRDIKPQNILVFDNCSYKIADFGEAKEIRLSKQVNSTLRGTELYMSPKLFNALRNGKEDINHNPYKSDVFSLAFCIVYGAALSYTPLYELRKLYDSTAVQWTLKRYLSGKFSAKFIELISKMLEIKEEDRLDFLELESYLEKNFK